jgi:hypothetical protein
MESMKGRGGPQRAGEINRPVTALAKRHGTNSHLGGSGQCCQMAESLLHRPVGSQLQVHWMDHGVDPSVGIGRQPGLCRARTVYGDHGKTARKLLPNLVR